MGSNTVIFDRRQVYRPFLERLNPTSQSVLESRDLIVPPEHDPRDPDQPPIYESFASTAELKRGSQMALVGGIGSGKTTELRLTLKRLKRHADAVNIYMDLAELTDLNELNPGAILIAIGLQLYKELKKVDRQGEDVKSAYEKLAELAHGKIDWAPSDGYANEVDPRGRLEHTPGLLKPRFPPMRRAVEDVQLLLVRIATPLLVSEAQITVLIDGLDRLIRPEQFREFVEQDLYALRDTGISIIVATPLLMWFDKSRFLQDYFDDVKHIPAAISDPKQSDFLNQVLLRRGAADLMNEHEISEIARFSGGVLRDVLTLARTSAEAAYRDDEDRIGPAHVRSAIRQLGNRYLVGLGRVQRGLLLRLAKNLEFPMESPIARELLVNRQVLEHFSNHREVYTVHPTLQEALAESA